MRERFVIAGGFHLAGPADEHRRADAHFVGREFCAIAFLAAWCVPAVVVGDDADDVERLGEGMCGQDKNGGSGNENEWGIVFHRV